MAEYTFPAEWETEHPQHCNPPSDAAGQADGGTSSPPPSAHISLSLRVMMALAEADLDQERRDYLNNRQDWKVDL